MPTGYKSIFGQPSSLGQVKNTGFSSSQLLPEHRDFLNQQRELELAGTKQTQKLRGDAFGLLENLLGGFGLTGEGNGGQGGGPPGLQHHAQNNLNNPFAEGISNIEQSRKAGIDRDFQESLNTSLARLQDRGLGGSTFALTAAQGNQRERQSALSDLSGDIGKLQIQGVESAQNQQLNQLQLLSQLLGGFF